MHTLTLYTNGPQAGWIGYVTGPGWTLFVDADGDTALLAGD